MLAQKFDSFHILECLPVWELHIGNCKCFFYQFSSPFDSFLILECLPVWELHIANCEFFFISFQLRLTVFLSWSVYQYESCILLTVNVFFYQFSSPFDSFLILECLPVWELHIGNCECFFLSVFKSVWQFSYLGVFTSMRVAYW